jgi:hypothetical protein
MMDGLFGKPPPSPPRPTPNGTAGGTGGGSKGGKTSSHSRADSLCSMRGFSSARSVLGASPAETSTFRDLMGPHGSAPSQCMSHLAGSGVPTLGAHQLLHAQVRRTGRETCIAHAS